VLRAYVDTLDGSSAVSVSYPEAPIAQADSDLAFLDIAYFADADMEARRPTNLQTRADYLAVRQRQDEVLPGCGVRRRLVQHRRPSRGGGTTTWTGLGFLLQGSMAGATWGSVNSPSDQRTGRILIGSGAAAVVIGIVLILTSRHSNVSGDVAPTLGNHLHSVLPVPSTLSDVRRPPPSMTDDLAGAPFWMLPTPALSLPLLRGAF
jgi:hypothetical protein